MMVEAAKMLTHTAEELKAESNAIYKAQEAYGKKYRAMLNEFLMKSGLDGDVVRIQDKVCGRLKVVVSGYGYLSASPYKIEFFPYKKDGTLSSRPSSYKALGCHGAFADDAAEFVTNFEAVKE